MAGARARRGARGSRAARLRHVRFVFGYGAADAVAADLPALDDAGSLAALAARYRATVCGNAGARPIDVPDVLALRTTWASKLAFSGHRRHFPEITGYRGNDYFDSASQRPAEPQP